MKDEERVIDLLRVAQVISVLAGIYVTHTEYMKNFNLYRDD